MTRFNKRMSVFLTGAALVSAPQPVSAQERGANDEADSAVADGDRGNPASAQASDDIVVTGSRIRGPKDIVEAVSIDRETIVAAGQVDLGEAIRALPQNFSGGQNPGIGTGAGLANSNVNSASSANLRGLGPDATLTLLNGHRLPYDSAFGGVDISAIPLAALDRIEVVPGGASAIYGSDAVAGVVNVILRQDFSGVATSGQIGFSSDGGYFRRQADIVGGSRWSSGGFLLAYDYLRHSGIDARQRSYADALDPHSSLYPAQHRHAVTLTAHQHLGVDVTAKLDALWSRRRSETIGGTAAARFLFRPEVESYTIAPSLEFPLGADWEARVLGVVGRDRTRYATTFAPQPGRATVTSGCFCNDVASIEAGAEGPLFDLAGGSARLAIGGGFRNNGMDYTRFIDAAPAGAFDVERRSRFVYGEIFLPFVSPRNDLRGIDRLSLSGAVRLEDYPGLDRLATPRIGVLYSPVAGLTLRGSWARSFKAPTLFQQFVPYQTFLLPAAAFGAGSGTGTVMYASGGNPDLSAERARTWSGGFEWKPPSMGGLTVSATWFDIRYRDRVVQPIAGSIAAAFQDPGYATLIDFSPDANELASLITGSQFGLQNFSGAAYDPSAVVALVDNRNINVAVQAIAGVDARLSWTGNLGEGTLGVDLAGSWLESSQQLTAALPEVRLAGTLFNPPRVRARANINYRSGALRLSSAVNYTGALEDNRFAQTARIEPGATIDFSASYDLIPGEGRDPGLSLSLAINNLLDDEPQIIRTTGPTDTPYDSTNFSPIGRFVAFGIRRRW